MQKCSNGSIPAVCQTKSGNNRQEYFVSVKAQLQLYQKNKIYSVHQNIALTFMGYLFSIFFLSYICKKLFANKMIINALLLPAH